MNIPREFQDPKCIDVEALEAHLGYCGRKVRIFQGCRIYPPGVVEIGDLCQIDENVVVFGGIKTVLGRNVHVAFGSSISGGGACYIGDFVSIGSGVRVITGTEKPCEGLLNNPTIPLEYRGVERSEVAIGDFSTIFTNTVIFPGVQIGEGCVVGAGSIVHRNLKPWHIYAGNPLVAIGKRGAAEVKQTRNDYLKNQVKV